MGARKKSARFVLFTVVAAVMAAVILAKLGTDLPETNPIGRTAEAQVSTQPGTIPAIQSAANNAGELSASEIALLQNLSARRQELDAREAAFETRERLLAETEKRIDGKIEKLAQIEEELLVLVEVQEEKEKERIGRLVRIYERMRPRDAARIIETLDVSLQLQVATRMRDIKMAAILSAMDPTAAQELMNGLARPVQRPQTDG